jgi:signal transduction histidine kinase
MAIVKKYIQGIILLLAIISSPVIQVYANDIDYHEDPETAGEVFSGLSLLQYYSDSLDTILQINPEKTESLLRVMPFANVPDKLIAATGDFNNYSITLSYSIAEIDSLWQQEGELLSQYQLVEAEKLRQKIEEELPSAFDALNVIRDATESIGSYLKIDTLSAQSALKTIYNEILEKLNRIEDMLDLYNRPLIEIEIPGITPEQLEEWLQPENLEDFINILHEYFSPTALTLRVEPLEAFVGDIVSFNVFLTTGNKPLSDRNVLIILNGIQYLEVKTDEQGYYRGTLQVPYWYIPEIDIQAIFYPQDNDIGIYLGSVSQISTLNVKYYDADLDLFITGQAYPGKSLVLSGILDYKGSPAMNNRQFNIYLDDNFAADLITDTSFETSISLPDEIVLGNHAIIASSIASGRYAPVITFLTIDVSQVPVYLDLNIPDICLIPGTINVTGELYSEFGPLENAVITFGMDDILTQTGTSINGEFTGNINKGMEFSLLGYQQISIDIQPSEPWNAPIKATRNIYIINYANIGIILAVLVIVSIILRARMGRRYRRYIKPSSRLVDDKVPVPISLTKTKIGKDTVIIWNKHEKNSLYTRIIDWYIRALKIVAEITSSVLQPHQTIREYAEANGPKLGFLQKVFYEFTCFIERLLYSSHKPTEEDVAVSREYSDTIRKEML